jgi:peptidyl-prolyl cis-trans isomerase SurA
MQSVVMRTGHIARNAGCAGIDEAGFVALADFMMNRFLHPAAMLCGLLLAAFGAAAQSPLNQPAIASPYGGTVVEDIVARVNDQIITQSDYDRAVQQLNEEGQQRGESMQEMAEARRDLLRNLIDQQLWLSKGKELGITGDTELIKKLDEIRKQYNMASLEDLENAAKQQGVSWEDFQQNIRNQIITQQVMRQEVGEKIQFTPGEAMQYYEQHKQDYEQPESVRLSEILISTGDGDPAKVAAAKAKADAIEARLKAGSDFAELARSSSDGPTAAQGGDLGQFRRGALAKVLEDKTFVLQAGQWTEPIRTRQGWVILKVTQHTPAGPQPYKDVQEQVEEALYMSRMEPAIRAYLTKMREEAFIDIKPGYVDTGASPNETKPVFSAYVPPAPKKKAKIERTRYREQARGFRQKSAVVSDQAPGQAAPAKNRKHKDEAEKPGKREKIRFGQAPRETLPAASAGSNTENAGALPESAAVNEPANPLEPTAPVQKTRFSDRARTEKKHKGSSARNNSQTPAAPDAAEVADRETQSAPLGLSGDTAAKKKKKKVQATTGEKTRMSQEPKKPSQPKPAPEMTPAPQEPGAPAPADHPTAQQPQQ